MSVSPKSLPEEKDMLHPRNKHRQRYNFSELIRCCSELKEYVSENQFHELSVDFQDSEAVKTLNKALLNHFYDIKLWDIPEGYLCPPVPGRADYIHYMADLLADRAGVIPRGKSVRVLDIGVGANCIYPLIGHSEYGWSFTGSEIDHLAVRSAKNIVEANSLSRFISIRKQNSPLQVFKDVIHHGEKFDLTICNPPFHASMQEAAAVTARKWKNLGKDKNAGPSLNFGGKNAELWCEGGEERFLLQMIEESAAFAHSCLWVTSLISKKETLAGCYCALEKVNAAEVKTINMAQGQKISRVLAWTFLDQNAQQEWRNKSVKP